MPESPDPDQIARRLVNISEAPEPWRARSMTTAEIAAGPPWHTEADVLAAPENEILILHDQRICFADCNCPHCDGSLQGFEANAESCC